MIALINNWKVYGRKWSWPILRHYPGIFLDGLRKAGLQVNI
jgi:hypothetical protein